MVTYTVSENDMLASIIIYLEDLGMTELSSILHMSRFVYSPRWEYSRILPNQKQLYANLKVPIRCKKFVENNKELLSKIACELYLDNDDYYFIGIDEICMLPIQTEDIKFEKKHIVFEKDSVFANFIKFIINNPSLNDIQKKYLFEACECGDKNNILSATVMLGASAEMLLFELSCAYSKYLKNQGDSTGSDAFNNRVVKAKCAHVRLNELLKRVDQSLFKKLGFEDLNLNFSFFDVIRQTRNDSGHPTGNTITAEQFKILLSNYQHLLPKVMDVIDKLPNL